MANRTSRWLKQHAAGEKVLAKVLRRYFREQGQRVVEKVRDVGLLPNVDAWVMDLADEQKRMQEAIAETVIGFMGTGAENVLAQAKRPRTTKAFDPGSLANFELPQWLKDEIGRAFVDLEAQQFWAEIQQGSLLSVTDAVRDAIEQGYSMDRTAEALQELFKSFSNTRSMAIARTETSYAFAAGNDASYRYLNQEGLLQEIEWLAVIDSDTRPEHAEANGQRVAVGTNFTIGSESAPYPAAPSLSAGQRIACRCTTVAAFE